ncbi:MAG: hypothetical protein SNI45_07380 [Rikenellaceae bacterium]
MEQGFDISSIKWIVILAIGIIYKFLTAKPRVDLQEEEQPVEPMDSVEQRVQEVRPIETLRRVGTPRAKETSRRRVEKEESILDAEIGSELGESAAEFAQDFDLRKAVIMSEILQRKYDE